MKRGFTLIELLTVIVILAIIALIATPIILNIIKDAKEEAKRRTVENYGKAVQLAAANYMMKNGGKKPENFSDISEYIKYDGETVNCDTVGFDEKGNVYLNFCHVGNDSEVILNKDGTNYKYGKSPLTLGEKILKDNTAYPDNVASTYVTNENGIDFDSGWVEEHYCSHNGVTVGTVSAYGYPDAISEYINLGGQIVTIDNKSQCESLPSNLKKYAYDSYFQEIDDISSCTGDMWNTCFTNINGTWVDEYNGKGLYYTNKNTEDNKNTYYFRGNVNNYVKFGGDYTYGQKWKDYGYSDYETCQASAIQQMTDSFNQNNYCMNNNYNMVYDLNTCIDLKINDMCLYNQSQETKPMLWRVLRINEDGSIRLISNEAIGSSYYNGVINDWNSANNIKYAGYMYGTDDEPFENIYDSQMKKYLDNFYENNLLNYSKYIADSGFCNERSYTNYGPDNIYYSFNGYSNFSCSSKRDLFTVENKKGNQKLKYPIGLPISAEMYYTNLQNEYNNGSLYYTMTPGSFYDTFGTMREPIPVVIMSASSLSAPVSTMDYVRPVINIKASALYVSGDGTIDNPYTIY